MQGQLIALPVSVRIEEVVFSLAGGASHDGPVIDTLDFFGGQAADFTDVRLSAFPFLDLALLAPGNVNLILQQAVNTTPGPTPTLVWSDAAAPVAIVGGAWGGFSRQRLTARFCRYRVTDTSLAANNGIYLFSAVRGI